MTTAQLHGHGIGASARARLVANGWLERVAPRVHRVRGAPRTARWRLRAGLLCLGEGSCVSFEAAAALYRFPGADPAAIEFTVARRRRSLVVPFVVHTTTDLLPVDVIEVAGLATTSPARTVIDLALAGADDRRLEATIVAAVEARTMRPEDLAARIADLRGPGRWGSRRIDLVAAQLLPSTASVDRAPSDGGDRPAFGDGRGTSQ